MLSWQSAASNALCLCSQPSALTRSISTFIFSSFHFFNLTNASSGRGSFSSGQYLNYFIVVQVILLKFFQRRTDWSHWAAETCVPHVITSADKLWSSQSDLLAFSSVCSAGSWSFFLWYLMRTNRAGGSKAAVQSCWGPEQLKPHSC